MKLITGLLLIGLLTSFYGCSQSETIPASNYSCTFPFPDSSANHSDQVKYQALLDDITHSGVPGMILSVHTPVQGAWEGAAGMADIANRVDLQPCNISRVGSTVKTFTAVTIMLLAEDGLLTLDDKVTKYLSGKVIDKIENADKSTIRQLLNHSSGIFNYIQNLQFQTASMNDLTKVWQPEELLHYAYGKPAYFDPGADVRYSNTNYILLGMIIEQATGKRFYEVFKERIFDPLQLSATQFAAEDPVPENIIRGYIDLYSNLQLLESTYYSGWDYYTADGGLISNPHDLSVFMRALFSGVIITEESLQTMLTWIVPKTQDKDFYPIAYGLGIFRIETPYGMAYYHSGDAIGYFAQMMYFEVSGTTLVWATNGNYGKIDALISSKKAMDQIMNVVFD